MRNLRFFKDIAAAKPLQERITKEGLQKLLYNELNEYGVKTPFSTRSTAMVWPQNPIR
jgi:hypothetical protein